MLTDARKSEISDLVGAWEQAEMMKEEYPSHYNGTVLTNLLVVTIDPDNTHVPRWDWLDEDDNKLLSRACREMGITLEEFKEWWVQNYGDAVCDGLIPSDELLERRLRHTGL